MKKRAPIVIILAAAVAGVLLYFFVFKNMGGEKPVVYDYYSPGEYFVTNVKGSSNLFKTSPVLVVDNSSIIDTLTKKNALVRDTIIFILRDYTRDELNEVSTHKDIRLKIIAALNERLETEAIVDVYFNDYVIQ